MTVPDLTFAIENAEPLRLAVSPHIVFKLRVSNTGQQAIHTVILKCQIQLDVSRRRYSDSEQRRLLDLFGEPNRWPETLRSMLWTNTSIVIPSFNETILADLPVPCSFDFNVAATKYFAGLEEGEIPISFYFSGTLFYVEREQPVQAGQISWEKEASYCMQIRIWREMMELYYPNTRWLCLQREAFDRLNSYKIQLGIPTFEEALMRVMDAHTQARAR